MGKTAGVLVIGVALALTASVGALAADLGKVGAIEGRGASRAGVNPIVPLTAKTFLSPPQLNQPWVRWNFVPAAARNESLLRDLQDLAAADIAGVEIGQGGEPTMAQWELVLEEANRLGIKVSVKGKGTADPLNGPLSKYSSSDDYVRKTLNARQVVVKAGQAYHGALPKAGGTVVAVLAYRCAVAECGTGPVITLDRTSVIDLTKTITGRDKAGFFGSTTGGVLDWTAPKQGGEWVVITIRAVRYQATPEIMSLEGTKQLIAAYEAYWSPEMKSLLRKNGGDFFVDSHSNDPWGLPQELWSSNMAAEFKAHYGYDLVPNLAALFDRSNQNNGLGGSVGLDSPLFYNFSDGTDQRIRNDHNQLRSDLFVRNRIEPFTAWLRGYNLAFRLQPEDAPPTSIGDQIQYGEALERPEHESLASGDQVDIFRPLASANHMTGNTWFSTECCAARGLGYAQTFQDMVVRMNKEYSGGVTKLVYHVYASTDGINQTWPGYSTFGKTLFSNAWSTASPIWTDAKALNQYFSRNQQVLTQGKARIDVAVYMQNYSWPQPWGEDRGGWGLNNHRFWKDLGLQAHGYSWDYLNPTLLQRSNAVVRGKRLVAEGPAYKAFIYDATLGPSTNTARGRLNLRAARKILEFARAGLPVIFVGQAPSQTPGNSPGRDGELKAVLEQILAQKSVSRVASEAEVPARLASLSIQPSAKPASASTILSVRRFDPKSGTNYYFIYNQGIDQVPPAPGTNLGGTPSDIFEEPEACANTGPGTNPCVKRGTPVDEMVTLEGEGAPYELDAWTGQITPIAEYTRHGGTVTVRVALASDASTIIALAPGRAAFGLNRPTVFVTSTSADSSAYVDGALVVRARGVGAYRTKLSDSTIVSSKIGGGARPMDLTGAAWTLDVEAWTPEAPYGTVGPAGVNTTKTHSVVVLSGLKSWSDVPQLKNTSGLGLYSTTVQLPPDWDQSWGATLTLGRVTDSFVLIVNGTILPMDQVSATADISRYLRPGANQIAVRVATTLNNQLEILDKDVANRGLTQHYGLIGPVVLTPYRQAVVWKPSR